MKNLIDARDEMDERRKKFKKRIDGEIALSHSSKDSPTKILSSHRLLDEGAIVGDEYVNFFIKKGTLEKFLNGENEYIPNVDDDFVGSVNLGHEDFATFPFIIGEFTKQDFRLVGTENGRKALDVELHLDEDSMFVKELKRQPYSIGLSAEFYVHVDETASYDLGFEVIDEVCIFAYALVGDCGNVNSDGLQLKGEKKVEDIKVVEEANEEVEAEIEEEIEEAVEEAEETNDEEEVEDEEDVQEDIEEVEDEESSFNEVSEAFESLQTQIDELTEQLSAREEKIDALEKKLSRVQKKLKAKNEEIEEFSNKFKGLSVSLGLKRDEKETKKVETVTFHNGSNGIGEL